MTKLLNKMCSSTLCICTTCMHVTGILKVSSDLLKWSSDSFLNNPKVDKQFKLEQVDELTAGFSRPQIEVERCRLKSNFKMIYMAVSFALHVQLEGWAFKANTPFEFVNKYSAFLECIFLFLCIQTSASRIVHMALLPRLPDHHCCFFCPLFVQR